MASKKERPPRRWDERAAFRAEGERRTERLFSSRLLEVDLGANRERIDAVFPLVGGGGRADREDTDHRRRASGRDRSAGAAGYVEMAVLGHEANVIGRVPDQAALIGHLLAAVDIEGCVDQRRTVVDAVAKLDIIDTAVELQRTPTALIERMQHLGAVPLA